MYFQTLRFGFVHRQLETVGSLQLNLGLTFLVLFCFFLQWIYPRSQPELATASDFEVLLPDSHLFKSKEFRKFNALLCFGFFPFFLFFLFVLLLLEQS